MSNTQPHELLRKQNSICYFVRHGFSKPLLLSLLTPHFSSTASARQVRINTKMHRKHVTKYYERSFIEGLVVYYANSSGYKAISASPASTSELSDEPLLELAATQFFQRRVLPPECGRYSSRTSTRERPIAIGLVESSIRNLLWELMLPLVAKLLTCP